MEEVKIRSGTRVKFKHIEEESFPQGFIAQLKEFAHKHERIEAVFLFALEAEGQPEQPSMSIAIRSTFFTKPDEIFLQLVDEIQIMLPDDLALNLYRFGASEALSKYCAESLEPVYLRTMAWLDKQRKKYAKV